MARYSNYPVDLVGVFDESPNRLLWIIKFVLLIPHYIVLWLFSLPTIITVPASWLSVVIFGRNPEFLWFYHTGLLRWSWRVNFYGGWYGGDASNTDQYPPFSLDSREDYPADIVIEYPESSSRLTGFLRWLLVIPHWIVVSLLGTIRSVLILLAMLALLFTGRYPESLFDIIMGLNRWSYRVSAYSMLLVDDYPPFSFD